MKLIDRIDRKPVAVAFDLRRTRAAGGVSLTMFRGSATLLAAPPSGAGVIAAAGGAIGSRG